MLFIDYSSAFNTIVQSGLVMKLRVLCISSALGKITDSATALVPLMDVCSAPCCSACSHMTAQSHTQLQDCHKFADYTTIISCITDGNESDYRAEVKVLALWCQDNNLLLNINKMKELIVDCRRQYGG